MVEENVDIHPAYGEIWIVDFGGDSEYHLYQGCRPALVVQSYCKKTATIYVAPMSKSFRKPAPYIQKIVVRQVSYIHYEQIVPITRESFKSRVRSLTRIEMEMMQRCLKYEFRLEDGAGQERNSKEDEPKQKAITVDAVSFEPEGMVISGRATVGNETLDYCVKADDLGLDYSSFEFDKLADYFNTFDGMRELMCRWSV